MVIKDLIKRIRVIPFLLLNNSEGSKQLQIDYNLSKCIKYYRKHKKQAEKYKKELAFLDINTPSFMQCRSFEEYVKDIPHDLLDCIEWDDYYNRYYCKVSDYKLFFPRTFSKHTCILYYSIYLFEQSKDSPHRYIDESFHVKPNDVLFDVGAAEGLFTLHHIDTISEAYVFECDDQWIEALRLTFSGMDKIHIVPKYVDTYTSDTTVKLDDYIHEINGRGIFIKMDIEGAEEKALTGMKRLIKEVNDIRCAICSYHKRNDSIHLTTYLEGMNYRYSDGYMLCLEGYQKPPYFRHGIIRANKEDIIK